MSLKSLSAFMVSALLLVPCSAQDNMGPPADSPSFTRLGAFTYREGRYEEAIPLLDKAIELDKGNALAYFWRGRSRLALRKHAEAVDDFDVTIVLKADNATAYLLRVDAKRKSGDHEGFQADTIRAQEISPSLTSLEPKTEKKEADPPEQKESPLGDKDVPPIPQPPPKAERDAKTASWYDVLKERFCGTQNADQKLILWEEEYWGVYVPFTGRIGLINRAAQASGKEQYWQIIVHFFHEDDELGTTLLIEKDAQFVSELKGEEYFPFLVPLGKQPIQFDFKNAFEHIGLEYPPTPPRNLMGGVYRWEPYGRYVRLTVYDGEKTTSIAR